MSRRSVTTTILAALASRPVISPRPVLTALRVPALRRGAGHGTRRTRVPLDSGLQEMIGDDSEVGRVGISVPILVTWVRNPLFATGSQSELPLAEPRYRVTQSTSFRFKP